METVKSMEKSHYDPRWFIWTVVFLLVSGISLASYIFITASDEANENIFFPVKHTPIQAIKK